MKQAIIFGVIVIILGLFIALGPQVLFKVCSHGERGYSLCHWTAQAEIGMGLLIAALGICMIVFSDYKTHLGLAIGIFLAGFIALFIPHTLIGGCVNKEMACRRIAFPALTVESIIVILFSIIVVVYIELKYNKTHS